MDEVLQCYQLLGLEPGASSKTVRKSYRDLVKQWHPDQFANDPGQRQKAEEKLKEINLAFERVQEHQTASAHHPINSTPTRRRPSGARSSKRATRGSSTPPTSPPPAPAAANETKASGEVKNSAANSSVWGGPFVRRPAMMAAIIAWTVILLLILAKSPLFFGGKSSSHRTSTDQERAVSSIPLTTTAPAENLGSSRQPREEATQLMLEVLKTDSALARSATTPLPKEVKGLPPAGIASGRHSQPAEETSLSRITESLKVQLSDKAQRLPAPIATSQKEDLNAQFQLGLRYANGEGVPQDSIEAIKLYRLAAEAGHSDAQKKLGFIYGTGQGVAQDLTEADKWLAKAASQGSADAGLANAVVALAKADAGRKAAADLSERVNQASAPHPVEDPEILFQLGLRHANGDGVPLNFTEAIKWYKLAAGVGHVEAQKKLGFLYASGKGVRQDDAEAQKWFRRAAAQGSTGAGLANALLSLAKSDKTRDSTPTNKLDKASAPADTNEVRP